MVPGPDACESRKRSLRGIERLSHHALSTLSASSLPLTAPLAASCNHRHLLAASCISGPPIAMDLCRMVSISATPAAVPCRLLLAYPGSWLAPRGSTW